MSIYPNIYNIPKDNFLLIHSFLDTYSKRALNQCSTYINSLFYEKSQLDKLPQELVIRVITFLNISEFTNFGKSSIKLNNFVKSQNPFYKLVLSVSARVKWEQEIYLERVRIILEKKLTVTEEIFQILNDNKISILDLNKLCHWQCSIKEEAECTCSTSRKVILELCMHALLLKKKFSDKYPDKEVEFNPEYDFSNSLNPTRNWLLIDGINAKKYEDQ